MKIILTGSTGGIGSAIKEQLKGNEFIQDVSEVDWVIFAHGIINEENVDQTFIVNTLDCIHMTNRLLPYVKKGFIYISSTSGVKGNTKFPVYSAAKAALNSYANTMARKYPELGFYALCPGPTDTKMWRSLKLEGKAQKPEEVAKVVEQIINGEYISGDIITVRDGKINVLGTQ